MKKLLALTLALLLCAAPALAELTGEYRWPEGSSAEDAKYIYRYTYPWHEGNDSVSEMINTFYQYLVEDAYAFAIPMAVEELDPASDMPSGTIISTEATFASEAYISYKVTTESVMGAAADMVIAGHTFALTGPKAGQVVALPYLLGVLDMAETDTWLQERQTAKVDACVRNLIWDIIQEQLSDGTVAYYDDLTFESLECGFYPEEDFYIDAEGNIVFFLQQSIAAPASEGVLLFPFTMEELLDEI